MDKCAATHESVLDLPWLERTLLWSIRTWAAYHDAPQTVWRPLEQAFADAGMRAALEPFAQLMSCLFTGLKRCPDIRCVRCLRLGKDERELLSVLAAAPHQSPARLILRLSSMMLPAAARGAATAAQETMRAIHDAGLRLQQSTPHADSDWPPRYQSYSSATH